jgi:hypothetical protein
MMNEIKWSNGEPCIRSKKIDRQQPIKEQTNGFFNEINELKTTNKRDIANDRINERIMISQIGQNPFLINNNYLEDLNIQETFLKPKNSSFQKD